MSHSQRYLIPGTIVFLFILLLVPATRNAIVDACWALVTQLQGTMVAVGLYF